MPVLYLPVNKRVEFVLNSRDVIHSFWVPAFMTKLDMIPGKTNRLQIAPSQTGSSRASARSSAAPTTPRCSSWSRSSPEEYDEHIAHLAEIGQTGQIPVDASREDLVEGDAELIPEPARSGSN